MPKLIVSANSLDHLKYLLNKDIDGVMLNIIDLSVNGSFYVSLDDIVSTDFKGKELFICINKIMHNDDLLKLMDTLKILKDVNGTILFYDMAVYNIAKEYDMVSKLMIYQDHLNASILSNRFYSNLGISGSFITSDITRDEILDIKNNTEMKIMMLAYGYVPIFYSRRYLIRNYLSYIGASYDNGNYSIMSDNGMSYPIEEEKYGTTIYSDKVINLINHVDEIGKIDYLLLKSNKIKDSEFNKMVDKFINHDTVSDTYLGFYDKKTIYKVK